MKYIALTAAALLVAARAAAAQEAVVAQVRPGVTGPAEGARPAPAASRPTSAAPT